MHLTRAVEILERLRDGEDPRTGRALPADSPYQQPDVVRALFTALAALPAVDAPEEAADAKPPRSRPARAGEPWRDDEDERLAAAFDEGRGVAELARVFGRSRSAIRLRLVKLGRLSEDEVAERGRNGAAAAAAV